MQSEAELNPNQALSGTRHMPEPTPPPVPELRGLVTAIGRTVSFTPRGPAGRLTNRL